MQNGGPTPPVSSDTTGNHARLTHAPRSSAARRLLPHPNPASHTSLVADPVASAERGSYGPGGQRHNYAAPPGHYRYYESAAPRQQQGQGSFAVQMAQSAPIPHCSTSGDRFYSYQAQNPAGTPYNTGLIPSPPNPVNPGLASSSISSSLPSPAYPVRNFTSSTYHHPSHTPAPPQHAHAPTYYQTGTRLSSHHPTGQRQPPPHITPPPLQPGIPGKRPAALEDQERAVHPSTPRSFVDASDPPPEKRRRHSPHPEQQGPSESVPQLQQQQQQQHEQSRTGPYDSVRPDSVTQPGYHSPTHAAQQRSAAVVSSASLDSHVESNEPLLQTHNPRGPTGPAGGENVTSARTDATRSEQTFGERRARTRTTGAGRTTLPDDESRPRRKREREKRRRETMKNKFSELQAIVIPAASGRTDKESILGEAVDYVRRQNETIKDLNEQNELYKAEIADLRQEKAEVRADKNRLREEVDKLRDEVDNLHKQLTRMQSRTSQGFSLAASPAASGPLVMETAPAASGPSPSFNQAQAPPMSMAHWEPRGPGLNSTRLPSSASLRTFPRTNPGPQGPSEAGRTSSDNNNSDNKFSLGHQQ